MDKLAEGLQKLGEDDLLQVVQMVHDNKSADSYTKNDVDSKCRHTNLKNKEVLMFPSVGEFHVDLYTLPDTLIKMLWDFTSERGAM